MFCFLVENYISNPFLQEQDVLMTGYIFGLQPYEKVAKVMQRPFYMNPKKAVEFGVADKVG